MSPRAGGALANVGSAGSSPSGLVIPGQSYLAGTVNSRRGVNALSGNGSLGLISPTNNDICQRVAMTLPMTPYRFRVRIRNQNVVLNTYHSGTFQLSGIWMGTPNTGAETAWAGDFTAAPVQVIGADTIDPAANGTEYVSAWITPATYQITANKLVGISMGFTCPGVQLDYDRTPGWAWQGTGSAAAAGLAPAPGTSAQIYYSYLDVRIEYEYVGTNEIGFFAGDSHGAGYLTVINPPAAPLGHMGPDNRWPDIACQRIGHSAMNAANGGSSAASWVAATVPTNEAFSRFLSPESGRTAFATAPDYAVIDLGLNDAFYNYGNGFSLATFQANIQTLLARLTGLGISRFYICTNMVGWMTNLLNLGGAFASARLSAAVLAAATTCTLAVDLGPGYYQGRPGPTQNWWYATGGPYGIYLGTPENPLGGPYAVSNATGGYTGTQPGTGAPGAITLTTAALAAAEINTPVLTLTEYARRQINQWVRNLPPGFTSVMDFDADTTSQAFWPSAIGRNEYWYDGDAHPSNLGAYMLIASRFVNGILGN